MADQNRIEATPSSEPDFGESPTEAAPGKHSQRIVRCRIEKVLGKGGIDATANSDVIILCASVPVSQDGPGRSNLAQANAVLFREWIEPLVRRSPNCVLVIVTNPVDVMTYLAWQLSGLPPERVIGTGTLIDSARFRSYLSEHLQIHPEDIRAYVLGEHRATQFPALSVAATGGASIDNDPTIARLFERTVSSAHEIFEIKGYTNYAIALATNLLVESILNDRHYTLQVSTLLDGFEEQHNVCLSIPSIIGRAGVVRQLHPKLSPQESDHFRACAETVRGEIAKII